MQGGKDTSRGALGGTSQLGAQQQGNFTYGVMPEQITKQLTQNPGSEFVVIQRTRQSEEPKVWSSGDPDQTQHLLQQVTRETQPA